MQASLKQIEILRLIGVDGSSLGYDQAMSALAEYSLTPGGDPGIKAKVDHMVRLRIKRTSERRSNKGQMRLLSQAGIDGSALSFIEAEQSLRNLGLVLSGSK